MTDPDTFRLEEYKALRKEVEIYLSESRSQERYTVIAVGVIWGWLVLNRLNYGWLWAAPMALTAASSVRMIAMLAHFNNLGAYIKIIEGEFSVTGWEHQGRRWTLGAAYVAVDLALLVLTWIGWKYRVELTRLPCPSWHP